jgi:hypothetical protein
MAYEVDFKNVEIDGLESSPVADKLAGLRANEARYFWNKYKHVYTTYPASEKPELVELIRRVLKEERDLVFESPILEVALYEDDTIFWPEFYYESGMAINLLYEKQANSEGKPPKRAVGIKLSEGMPVPDELEGKFKFARQRSKLAGEIRGSFFVVKQEWL